jgi:hypothetical protein
MPVALVIIISAVIASVMVFLIFAGIMAVGLYRKLKAQKELPPPPIRGPQLHEQMKMANELLAGPKIFERSSDIAKAAAVGAAVGATAGAAAKKANGSDSGDSDGQHNQTFVAGEGAGGLFSELLVDNSDDSEIWYAKYPFTKISADDLELNAGDTVYVVDKSDPTRWRGIVDDGKYLSLLERRFSMWLWISKY